MVYLTLENPTSFKEVIKGSSFIAYVDRAESVGMARKVLELIRQEHPNATHHCWAYCIANQYRFSDDGEPSGTAGKPILEVLTRQRLDRVMAVVVRYFGGTKLGASGLVRAYSGTLAKALKEASLTQIRQPVNLTLSVPFTKMDAVYRFLKPLSVTIENHQYTEIGVKLDIVTFLGEEKSLIEKLSEITCGQVKFDGSYKRTL